MKFNVNQQELQQALNYCQGVIEKRSTLPILSNILLDASNSKLTITATDLDLIFIHQLNNIEKDEIINDLIIAAYNDARDKLKKKTSEEVAKATLIPNLPLIKLAIKIRTGTWARPPITILVSE